MTSNYMKIWNFTNGCLTMSWLTRAGTSAHCKRLERLMVVCLVGLMSTAHGTGNEQVEQKATNTPDLEFLEFLGQFETDAGEWIDPESLLTEEFDDLLVATTNIEVNSGNSNTGINDGNDNDQQGDN